MPRKLIILCSLEYLFRGRRSIMCRHLFSPGCGTKNLPLAILPKLPWALMQESWKLGVHEVELLLCCVEHGGAVIVRWGAVAADKRYANPVTNPT
jgi:hypothetical protein